MFARQEILKLAAVIWIVASVIYIGYDTWNDYKIKGIGQAYQSGFNDMTKQLFDKSKENACKQSMEISLGAEKLELIDVKCVQSPKSQVETPQLPQDQPGVIKK